MAGFEGSEDDDTPRTTFVAPKWLSVKENHYIQAFPKISFALCRGESMFRFLLYSIESMPLLSIR